jgi:hypothetical protein
MKPSKLFLKIAAVVVAVGLGGTLIAYRAGAFQRSAPPAPQPEPQPIATQPSPEPQSVSDPKWIMYGSKSAPAFIPEGTGVVPPTPPPPQPPPSTTQPAQNPPTLLGGSKSKAVIGPSDLPMPTTSNAQATPPQAPTPPKP